MQPGLIAIVGPTAVGKTDLAIDLARRFDGEVVNADSRQVYRYMDIGTAKPTPAERALAPHHLINIVDPDEDFTLATYQQMAFAAIDDIHHRRKLPLLVGGSGLYVWAVVEGMLIPRVPPNPALRAELERRASEEGGKVLYQELLGVDPVSAAKIHPHNVRRVVRALEVFRLTGVPISQMQGRQPPPFRVLIIGLTVSRDILYQRIDLRVDKMIEIGLVEETEELLRRGYGWDLPAMSSLGYQQIGMYLRGELSLPKAIQLIKTETHRFARQQYTWFRLSDPRIHWFDVEQDFREPVAALTSGFVSSGIV